MTNTRYVYQFSGYFWILNYVMSRKHIEYVLFKNLYDHYTVIHLEMYDVVVIKVLNKSITT